MIEDMGNAVKINDTIIPAVNIQVDGYPKFEDGQWYNIYFEVMFEWGDHWVVEVVPGETCNVIRVEMYYEWNKVIAEGITTEVKPLSTWQCKFWEEFLTFYKVFLRHGFLPAA